MIRESIKITASDGLHARPAATLVKLCSQLNSDIHIIYNGNTCNAKSMMAVLKMGIKKDAQIEFEVSGGEENNNMKIVMETIRSTINH